MHPTSLVLLALGVGLVVGGGFVALLVFASSRGERAVSVASNVVPDGVDQVLDAMESAGIVTDASLNVVKASARASALALVSNGHITYPELTELVNRVRRSGESVEQEFELQRGRFKDAGLRVRERV